MVFVTFSRALKKRFDLHRKIARWTLPIWLYVSVTGVIVYLMLYQTVSHRDTETQRGGRRQETRSERKTSVSSPCLLVSCPLSLSPCLCGSVARDYFGLVTMIGVSRRA